MENCYLLDENNGKLSCFCETNILYQLIISHRFPKVDSEMENLFYYITINDHKIYTDIPELLNTSKIFNSYNSENDIYTSMYKITIKETIKETIDDNLKLTLVLPFDYNRSIVGVELFKYQVY
jgi:hypothetical protein